MQANHQDEYEFVDDYDFRSGVVAEARSMSETAGHALTLGMIELCERYVLGKITEDEFKREIIRPCLH